MIRPPLSTAGRTIVFPRYGFYLVKGGVLQQVCNGEPRLIEHADGSQGDSTNTGSADLVAVPVRRRSAHQPRQVVRVGCTSTDFEEHGHKQNTPERQQRRGAFSLGSLEFCFRLFNERRTDGPFGWSTQLIRCPSVQARGRILRHIPSFLGPDVSCGGHVIIARGCDRVLPPI